MDTGAPVTQIGKYPILSILGVGGMGVVYRGMDKSVGREVAIKTLTAATEELRQRFLLEARSGILNHPNIVTVYDSGEQDGNPYIVMELVRGDSLENLLRSGRLFSLIDQLEIIHQTCLGLGYAHKMGIVHRDIKPANIMVQPDGNIKIVDFGVARLENLSGHTQTGMVIGTFHYISPERLLGKIADGRADIWSAGVMLYRLLAGRLPFPGDDISILQKVIHEPFDPLQGILTDYPAALDQVLEHALAKNPADRYETAEDMAADIEAINEGLKREHVSEMLGNVKPLMDQEQWASVRPVLLDLQRLNPQNTEVKRLLREVQNKLSRQQKTVHLQQLLVEAEEAVLSQRYVDALEFYNQAAGIDPTNPELAEKIAHARKLKEKSDTVASLLEQSREARKRSDYGAAGELIDRALQLDERNTDLRNERARIVQELERANKERARKEFSDAGRGQLAARQFTEAIKNLRAALEIDPTDTEIQQLYQGAVERQEGQRRRAIIEQIVAEITNSISGQDFERALSLIQRAQEHLPGEPVLLQLKADAETGLREQAAKKLVEKTSLDVSSLFVVNPQQALAVVQQALEQIPGEPRLISLEEKVFEQVRKVKAEELKTQYLKRAQASIDAKQFDQAIQILEDAAVDCGEGPDFASLLNYARENKRRNELGQVAANATREAKTLIGAGEFEAAIAILQPAAAETGDASVEQLLRQASSSLAELVRRIDAVLSRAQVLSEQDIERALQLLSSQPQEIQQHSRVRELRASLESTKERERLTREAIQGADDALQKQDLRNGLTGLESVQRRYGDSPRLSSAIAEYQSKRTQIANELLTAAIESATQAIQQEDRPRAAEALGRVADAADFADSGLQANLKRLAKDAGKAPTKKQVQHKQVQTKPADTGTVTAKAKPGFPWALLFGGIAVVLLGAAGAGYWYFLRPAPAIPMGVLELNATPYAEVVGVTSGKGSAFALPAGDHWTPLRIEDIPLGKYSVEFKGADGSIQTQQCDVAQSVQICNIELKPIDDGAIDKIMGGTK